MTQGRPRGFVVQRHDPRHPHKSKKKPNQIRFLRDCVRNGINTAIKRRVCRGRNHLKLLSLNFWCPRAGAQSLEANGGSVPGSVRLLSPPPLVIKCGCPDYPAVRHRSKWVRSSGRGGRVEGVGGCGGMRMRCSLTRPPSQTTSLI